MKLTSRIDALERAAQPYVQIAVGTLTERDCNVLQTQIVLSNVRMEAGRAVRTWTIGFLPEHTAELDQAIARCNAQLAADGAILSSSDELDVWLTFCDIAEPAVQAQQSR